MSTPGHCHFGTETCPHPTACRLQCWDASGQTTNSVGTQPHPSADRVPKVILSPQLPLNTPLDMALAIRGKDPAPSTSGQVPVPPTRKPAQAPQPTSPTREQTPEAKGTTILQPAEQRTQMQKLEEGKKKNYKHKSKTIKKMVIGTHISIITLNVNGLNAPTKRHRLAKIGRASCRERV